MIATVTQTETDEPSDPKSDKESSPGDYVRQQRMLKSSLNALGLSIRTVNALENDDGMPNARGDVLQVHTVEQLLQLLPEDITAIPNLGEKTLQEIFTCLARHGFVRKGFVVKETEEDRAVKALQLRQQQLYRRIGYRR